MNLLKRAQISIVRRPTKMVILLLLIFLLGSVTAGALAVSRAISNTNASLRHRMRPIVSINFDWVTANESGLEWQETPTLTPSVVRAIGDLEYVDFYDYTVMTMLRSFELQEFQSEQSGISTNTPFGHPMAFRLHGTAQTDLIQINQGIIDLTVGRQFYEHELVASISGRTVAIISQPFAEINGLTIGSVFELYQPVRFPEESEILYGYSIVTMDPNRYADEFVYTFVRTEFEIIGLYEIPINPDLVDEDLRYAHYIRNRNINTIYVPNWAIEDANTRISTAQASAWAYLGHELPNDNIDFSEWTVIALFVLEDPAYLETFRETATELLPSEFHYFVDLFSDFEELATSMITLQNVASLVLYGSIIATILVLGLLIILFLHDRRHEIGIYLALGERKRAIILQVLFEVVVIGIVGITLAIFAGHQISRLASQNILEHELMAQMEQRPRTWDHFSQSTVFDQLGVPSEQMSIDEMINVFDVSISVETVILFYVIGLGTVILSTLIPVIYIVKLNPKKVLL